jgi:hypothetical protein
LKYESTPQPACLQKPSPSSPGIFFATTPLLPTTHTVTGNHRYGCLLNLPALLYFVSFRQDRARQPSTTTLHSLQHVNLRVSRFGRISELKHRLGQLQFNNIQHSSLSSHHGFSTSVNMAPFNNPPSLKATVSATPSTTAELPSRRLRALRPADAHSPASTQHHHSWAYV